MPQLLLSGAAPMELDMPMGSDAVDPSLLRILAEDYCSDCSESEHWETCSTETFKLGHVHFNHKISISFVEKPLKEGGKPWTPFS